MTEDRAGLEFARDGAAAMYVNAWVRLMADHLGVPVESNEDVAKMAPPIVAGLNEGVGLGWAIAVGDRAFADGCLETLRRQVEEGFAP